MITSTTIISNTGVKALIDSGKPSELAAYEYGLKMFLENRLSPEDRAAFVEKYGDPTKK